MHYVHTYEKERLGVLESRSREKQPLGTAFPTTHIIYKCMWPQPELLGAFSMCPEHKGHGASSASSHVYSSSPRDLGLTSGVSPSRMGLGLSQWPVGAGAHDMKGQLVADEHLPVPCPISKMLWQSRLISFLNWAISNVGLSQGPARCYD